MNYYWYKGEMNVGDLICPYLVEKITGNKAIWNNKCNTSCLVGSILDGSVKKIHWSTGVINKVKINPEHTILAVRGPVTKYNCLVSGITIDTHPGINIFGDSGLTLPRFYNPPIEKKYKLGIIPHYIDKTFLKNLINKYEGDLSDIKIIDIQQEPENFIDDLLQCTHTVSSSLHGLILSIAYNIPTRWIRLGDRLYGNDCKFWDFYLSLQGEETIDRYLQDVINGEVDIPEWNPINIQDELPDVNEMIKSTNTFIIPDEMVDILLSVCPLK